MSTHLKFYFEKSSWIKHQKHEVLRLANSSFVKTFYIPIKQYSERMNKNGELVDKGDLYDVLSKTKKGNFFTIKCLKDTHEKVLLIKYKNDLTKKNKETSKTLKWQMNIYTCLSFSEFQFYFPKEYGPKKIFNEKFWKESNQQVIVIPPPEIV